MVSPVERKFMPSVSTKSSGKIRWISDSEMKAIVDKRARAVLNISGNTFMQNRKRGMYAKLDADDCPGIVELALLAPSDEGAHPRGRKKR